MKKHIKNVLLLLLLGITIYLCFRNYKLKSELRQIPESSIIGIPDTIKTKEPFKPVKPYIQQIEPSRIFLYDYFNVINRLHSKDSITTNHITSTEVITKKDSLVQILLEKDQLNLSLFNNDTDSYSSRVYKLDLDSYNYNWYEGQLTKKKVRKLSLSPYVYGKYRPFNQLFDIGSGISIKTKSFNYKLGVNAFCYPKFFSGIKADIEFSVTYNF